MISGIAMPATREMKRYVEKELPYRLLTEMYNDSRRSLKELARSLKLSHHTLSKALGELEERYGLYYTLDIDTDRLGFSEGRIITIRFGAKPGLDFLKGLLQKDVFVQDAYLATGDFDLLLYVIGLTPKDFAQWQWKLRRELSEYKPLMKLATVNSYVLGVLPIRSGLIDDCADLSGVEKKILKLLNENSREKLGDLVRKAKTTQVKAIYAIRKLKEEKIIRRFTALTQNPEKRILAAHTLKVLPVKNHLDELLNNVISKIVAEDLHESTSDYSLILDTVGEFDEICICTFKDGETMGRRGPNMYLKGLAMESPEIDRSILTDVIVGKWPFHLDDYGYYNELMKERKEVR